MHTLIAASANELSEEAKLGGIIFWCVLFLAGMLKCRALAQRPTTNAATCNGLALVLLSFMGFFVLGYLRGVLDLGRIFPYLSLGTYVLTLSGAIYAARGLVEIKRDDEGRYRQGKGQGILAIVLTIIPTLLVGYGALIAFRDMATLGAFSGNRAQPPAEQSAPKQAVYPFKQYDFELANLPDAWAPTDPRKLNNLSCAAFRRLNPEAYMIMVAEPNQRETTLDSAAQNVRATLESKGLLGAIVESERAIDGMPGRLLRFQRRHENLTLDYASWIGVGQNFCYQMIVWKQQDQRKALDLEFAAFAQALKFTEVALPDQQIAEAAPEPKPEDTQPPEKTLPPFALKAPALPLKTYGEMDLAKMDADNLLRNAYALYGTGKFSEAAQFQHWYHLKTKAGLYSLACYYGCAGKVNESIYFLQETGLNEGCDPAWAARDSDLQVVHADPRWPKLKTFLDACATYWRKSVKTQVPVIYPKNYKPNTPVPVLVGLHGLGDSGNNFVDENMQGLADELGIVIVGVSGTHANGPTSFSWSEHTRQDAEHVLAAVGNIPNLKIAKGQLALYGFSQGGEMSFEMAAKYPNHFCGAIALSPGSQSRRGVPRMTFTPANQNQRFIFVAGAGEHPATVRTARDGHAWAERASAKSQIFIYPNMNTHSFPPDFHDRIAPWTREVLQLPSSK